MQTPIGKHQTKTTQHNQRDQNLQGIRKPNIMKARAVAGAATAEA